MLLAPLIALAAVYAVEFRDRPREFIVCISVAASLSLLVGLFSSLTVEDEGDYLKFSYGPVPSFRKRFAFSEISSVEDGRSKLIDGWGIHYIPWRGWTYNLWGFDCAVLTVNGRTVRIGSDDVPNLVEFLRRRIAQPIVADAP